MRHGHAKGTSRLIERIEHLRAGHPARPFPFEAEMWHLKGLLAWEEGDRDLARALLARGFARDPSVVGLGADFAIAYAEDGLHEEALDVISRALEASPGDHRLLAVREQIRPDSD